MTSEPVVVGAWGVDKTIGLMIVGEPADDNFALSANTGAGWEYVASFENRKAADTAATIIERLTAAREHARMGGDSAASGAGTDHPGVEWVTSRSDTGSTIAEPEEFFREGMARLWVVGGADGKTFGLLNPGASDDERVLGYFESEETADTTIRVIDALIEGTSSLQP